MSPRPDRLPVPGTTSSWLTSGTMTREIKFRSWQIESGMTGRTIK
jgi:hypothetical protein